MIYLSIKYLKPALGKILAQSLLWIFVSISYPAAAQVVNPAKYEVGIHAGAFVYQGDLAPRVWGSIKTTRPGFGGYIAKIFSPFVDVRFAFNISSLKGDETKFERPAFRRYRAFKFTSTLREFHLLAKLNLEEMSAYTLKWKPYIFAGVGIAYFDRKMDYSEFQPAFFGAGSQSVLGLVVDITKPSQLTKPVIPVGVGLRNYLTRDVALNIEGSYRLTNTDYIDGYSESANPSLNDHYLVLTVGLSYKFGRKSKYACPVVSLY